MGKKNRSRALHNYLKQHHIGRKNAVSSGELEAAFHLKGAAVRKCVNELRSKGIPICSSADGYYYASSSDEINATIAQLDSRIAKITQARNGIVNSVEKNKST